MSRWAEPVQEFHQLVTPDGEVFDLHTASRNGRWVMNSQGWGMPGVDWITQQSPFQHGSTVMDYRLQPRMLQLMVRHGFCTRDQYWAGREALINALRPNRTPISFTDSWMPRSQYQAGWDYFDLDLGAQTSIKDLAVYNDLLYGGTGHETLPSGEVGGELLVWDGAGSWVKAAVPPSAISGATTVVGTAIESLLSASMLVPVFGEVLSNEMIQDYYNTDANIDDSRDIDLTHWWGQVFVTSREYILSKIAVKVARVGLGCGTLSCSLYATDIAGHPTGDPLTRSSAESNWVTLDVNGEWYQFGGSWATSGWTNPNITLQAGVKYAVVLSGSEGGGVNHINWLMDTSASPYGGGSLDYTLDYSGDGGASWSTLGGNNWDAMFEVYGKTYTTGKVGEETRELLLAGCSVDGIVVPWDGTWQSIMGAFQLGAESTIWDMIQWGFDGNVYCATGGTGLLLKYSIDITTGAGSLVSCAAHLVENNVYCLAAYDDGGGEDIYGGTSGGTLVRWNGAVGGTWTTVCAIPLAQTAIWDLVVHHGYLYGCTGPDGYLVRYDVTGGHWDVVSQSLTEDIKALLVFKGRLYGSGESGYLYRWNDSNAWETICPDFLGDGGLTEEIQCMIGFNGRLMAGTSAGAYLLEWVRKRLYDRPQCMALRRLLSNGQKRDLCVFIAEGPKFDVDEPGWDERGFTEMLRFVAYDPTMYNPDAVTEDFAALGLGPVSAYEDIVYAGTWSTKPTLVLTGPLNTPSVINEGIDEFISLDYDIPAGDIVTIDLNQGTIEDNHGANLTGALTADSHFGTFRLVPHPELHDGTNRVRVVAGGATVNSDFAMQYFTRYVGI